MSGDIVRDVERCLMEIKAYRTTMHRHPDDILKECYIVLRDSYSELKNYDSAKRLVIELKKAKGTISDLNDEIKELQNEN